MREVNSLGTLCPQPIIDLAQEIARSQSGELIRLHSDDPATWLDLLAWGRMTGHEVTRIDREIFEIIV